MPLVKVIIKDKAVYFVKDGEFELNGKIWRVIGVEIRKRKAIYIVKNGSDIHEVTEESLIERHKRHGKEIKTIKMSEV